MELAMGPPNFFSFGLAIALVAWSPTGVSAQKYKVVHSFCAERGCPDGAGPQAPVVVGPSGDPLGAADGGGRHKLKYGNGTAFEIRVKGANRLKFLKLANFDHSPGQTLFADTAGAFYGPYGVTGAGIFKVLKSNGAWTTSTLQISCSNGFCGTNLGMSLTYVGAAAGQLYDGVSPIFGTTTDGGLYKSGTIFQLVQKGDVWTETVIYSFCATEQNNCPDGYVPSGLVADARGNLFGTAITGGTQQGGVVFELSPNGNSWSYTILHTFCSAANCSDGFGPNGALALDQEGTIYGTTERGGIEDCPSADGLGCGVLYKVAPNGVGSVETVLYAFCQKAKCADGRFPYGGVMRDSASNLFGTTPSGGNSYDGGVVFEYGPSGFSVLHTFCSQLNCADGYSSLATLTEAAGGELFGTTGGGGEFGGPPGSGNPGGTVFEISP